MSYKTIGVEPKEFYKLKEIKQETEKRLNAKLDWGSFLVGALTGGIVAMVVQNIAKEKKKGGEIDKDG